MPRQSKDISIAGSSFCNLLAEKVESGEATSISLKYSYDHRIEAERIFTS